MTIKVAINGYGRIGRNILRAHYEYKKYQDIEIVAVNTKGDVTSNAHLTRYDSTHGRFTHTVETEGNDLLVDGDHIRFYCERDPENIPWGDLGVDVVYECTGHFKDMATAGKHLKSGAKKVMISAPGASDVEKMIVYGVNDNILNATDTIISNASCTTNCIAPIVLPLHEQLGIESGLMNTIHAYTNDQVLTDSSHKDLRRARAAAVSLIPTKTGAASALGRVIPAISGKLDGLAIRVPTNNVSLVDLTFIATRATTVEDVNNILQQAAEGPLKDVLAYNIEPLVSIDFNHHPASAIFDATQTKVEGNLVKVLAWYDNEWGYSNRMLDLTDSWMSK